MSKVFSERLTSLRKERYPSQKEGAAALDVSISRYNKWETDTNSPDYETVCMIADHYGVSTDYLLGRTDAKHPENTLLVSELGLSDKAIEAIKDFRTGNHPQYPLYRFRSGGDYVVIDQSCDKRTLLDVLDAMLCSSLMESSLNVMRTLTSPIVERTAAVQWEGEAHASYISLENAVDENYRKMLHGNMDTMASNILDGEVKRKNCDMKIDIFKDTRDKQDGE